MVWRWEREAAGQCAPGAPPGARARGDPSSRRATPDHSPPSPSPQVELLRRAWDQGQSPLRFTQDAVAIAGSLRLWLACLPDGVLPARLYHPLLHAASLGGGAVRVRALQALLRQVRTCGGGRWRGPPARAAR